MTLNLTTKSSVTIDRPLSLAGSFELLIRVISRNDLPETARPKLEDSDGTHPRVKTIIMIIYDDQSPSAETPNYVVA